MANTHETLESLFVDTANAIRAKTGGTADIVADEFPQAIESIPSGGGADYFQYATSCNSLFQNAALPNSISIALPNATDLQYMFSEATGGGTIELTLGSRVTSMAYFMGHQSNDGKSAVTKLKISGDLSAVTSYIRFARYCAALSEVDADIDFRSVTNSTNLGYLFYTVGDVMPLKARFKANTLRVDMLSHVVGSRILDDDSLLSLANCLKAASGTVALSIENKQRCATLLGTVSQRTDDTGTYDFFTADAGGTVSLQNFITQTKGWTIA